MKTIQSLILGASIILVSANSFAGPIYGSLLRSESSTIKLSNEKTKQEAFKSGLSKLSQLKSTSTKQLSQELQIHGSNLDGSTLHLKDGGYINVEERMNDNGNITYTPHVTVSFHYAERQ